AWTRPAAGAGPRRRRRPQPPPPAKPGGGWGAPAVDPVPDARPAAGGERKAAARIVTLGCRLNAFESEVMRHRAEAAGLTNATIVNTCAVTGEAVRQAAQTIRRLHREQPSTRIIVTGCAAQIEPHRFDAMPEVDAVIGNAEKGALGTFQPLATATSPRVQVTDTMSHP